ncbi:lonely Cys domain-containing protein, partial [Streptomyces sp. NPDC096080]|uniref:lonely Cys domain-containing protein n=1 Tax=Streptomyces sp. NPDC096080 TaxID=3156693 RepID=UPI003332742A
GTTAGQRADTVAAAFRRHLDHALTSLGADTADLSGDDFGLTVTRGTAPRATAVTVRISTHRLAAPVLRLQRLARAELGASAHTFRPERLTRRVLGLPARQHTRAQAIDLYTLTGLAMRDGRAGSLAELAAYHAEKRDALYTDRRFPATETTPAPGLNWTDLPAGRLYTGTVGVLSERPGTTPEILDSHKPPWAEGPTPYLLAATMKGDRVTVPWTDGTTRDLTQDRFVRRVLEDPELAALPPEVPIVLAVPFGGAHEQHVARLLAELTGRTVWAHSGDLRLVVAPDGERLALAVHREPGRPLGDWFPVPPGLLPDTSSESDSDSESDDHWHDQVLSFPLAGSRTGLQIGRASFQPDEMAVREVPYRHLDQVTTYVHHNFAAGTYSRPFTLEPAARGQLKAFFAAHGGLDSTTFATVDGTSHEARGDAGAKWLKKRKSFDGLLRTKDDWLGLVTCLSASSRDSSLPRRPAYGRDGFVPNPLRQVPQGQHYANEMRHKVSAATVRSGVARRDGTYVRALVTDPQGRWGTYAEFFPEPDRAELERRAGLLGLTGPDAAVRTLDLVRALRQTLGNEIDDDVLVDSDPDYARLLRGAGALERMWRADGRFAQAGPFTLDLLRRAATARLPEGGTAPGPADVRALLTAAADAPAGTTLRDFVTLPASLDRAADWLGGPHADRETADLLRLPGPDRVDEDSRSLMFWARVKAYEALGTVPGGPDAYTARVLHLDPDSVDDARREQALTLTAHAYAVGRDGARADEVAAHHLETDGALDDSTLAPPAATGGPATGRNLLGPARDTAVDLSSVHTPAGPADAPWHGTTARGKDRPHPYVVHAEIDRTDPTHLLVAYGTTTRRIPTGELVELLANDPELTARDAHDPVLLAVSELDRFAPGLAQDLAQRVGRGVYSTAFPLGPHTADATRDTPVLALRPSPATGAVPTVADLRLSTPRALDTVSSPAPQALPPVDADATTTAPAPGTTAPGLRLPDVAGTVTDPLTAVVPVVPPPPSGPPSSLGTTPPPGQNPRPRAAGVRIDEELDERRPARLDADMLPPPRVHRPSAFTDESRLPGYVDGFLPLPGDESDDTAMPLAFGQSDVYIRNVEQITDHLDAEMRRDGDRTAAGPERSQGLRVRGGGIEESVFRRIQRAMRERPQTFAGDGREFVYRTESGRLRKMHITLRNYGEWTKFTDGGALTKVDNVYRAQATVGGSKTIGQTRQFAPTAPLGPQSGPVSVWGRIGMRIGRIREVTYSAQDRVLNVGESRGLDTSHPYLDDAYLDVSITDAEPPRPAKPGVLHTRWRAEAAREAAPDVRITFGVRNGLLARLTDGATRQATPGRTPATLQLGPESDYRLVITEDFGPVAAIRDWAVDRIGAAPDSSAYRELDRFLSSQNFHKLSGRLAKSAVPGRPLFADDKKNTPLGAFVIERVVPGRAVLAVETDKTEMRESAFLTVQNTRKQTKAYSKDFTLAVGPTFTLPSFGFISDWMNTVRPRLQFGASARLGHVRGRSAMTGGSGAVRSVGRAKNVTTDLYRVEKTVWIRKTGDARPTPFTTWSLDRMTRSEARRLAGMEDENVFGSTEPFAPAYLTENHPPTLGMSRPVQFTYANGRYSRRFPDGVDRRDTPVTERDTATAADTPRVTFAERTRLDSFTRQVLTAVAAKYPTMVARLEDLGDPSGGRWRNHAHYQMVLHNTLTVINALSHHSMGGNLESMSRTGLRVGLVDPGRFTRGYHYIWIDAELTNRTWVSPTDTILRHSAPGATDLDESQYGVQGMEAGFEGVAALRDTATDNIGFAAHALTAQFGYSAGRQARDESGYGSTATFDQMAITTKPGNIFAYDLSLTVSTGGYWRPRSLLRGLVSFGVLGTQLFVMGPKGRGDIIGGDADIPAIKGKVLLSVPSDHSPATDPHAPGADNPYLDPEPVTSAPMTRGDARKLLDASTEDSHTPGPLDGLPHQTLSVVAPRQDRGIVDRVLEKASHNRWQLTREGAPAHDAAVRPQQPQFLTANADQNASATGSRTTGLFGKGPYIDWLATVVHRMRITEVRALTRPQPMETEMTLGGSTKAAGAQSRTVVQQAGVTAVYGHSHPGGPGVTGSYGLSWRPWWRSRGVSGTVVRTVTSDINRVDQGYQVLATGDAEHEVAAETRSSGVLAPLGKVVRKLYDWAGERQTVKGGWLGHLPERVAHQLGLIDGDALGGGPRYTGRRWLQPRWFRTAPFATYPVNSLNTGPVVERFVERLDDLGLDEDSREAIHRLTSARVTRALRREMTGTGSSVTARISGFAWKGIRVGGRNVRVRVRLEPVGEQEFVRLWPRTELEDHRWATETFSEASPTGRGSDAGTMVNEAVHTDSADAPMAGPSLTETGSNRQTISAASARASGRLWTSYTSEPHAEYATRYRLHLTMEVGRKKGEEGWGRGARRIQESGEAGRQHEIVPLSLMRPDSDPGAPTGRPDPLAPPEIDEPPAAVNVLTGEDSPLHQASPFTGVLDAWRSITLPDGTQGPFVPPENGFHVRNVLGAENVLAASTLALGKAYDNRFGALSGPLTDAALDAALRTARVTPLTAEGTGSAQVLEDSHGPGALSAFFEHASGNDGYVTSGLVENALADHSEGTLQVFSRPDFTGAVLLAVADGARMESTTRTTQSDTATAAQGGDHNTAIGGAPALKSDNVGAANPGASGTGADTSDSDGRIISNDQARQVNVKPTTGRVFAFAIPMAWLSVADVHRQFKDMSGTERLRTKLLGSLGGSKPGPQTVESQTQALVWVREDVARQLGLITDDTFPAPVSAAWDKVKDAAKTWADEDGAYWELRRELPDLGHEADETRIARSGARRDLRVAKAAAKAERTAARARFTAATTAAAAVLTQAPADAAEPLGTPLRSAADLATQAQRTYQDALLETLTEETPAPQRAAVEARIAGARQALTEANDLVRDLRRRERDRLTAEARRVMETRT